ncbi:MAG: hypothetical protein QOD57_728, partial [Actinomycetota bacterium]|nr:hypothetical protein [Actinomycetota bacterium]
MDPEWTVIGHYQGRGPDGHVVVTPDGRRVVLEPANILNSRLENVPAGAKVKVQKTGRTVQTKGGRKGDEYQVFVAQGSLNAVQRAVVALLGFGTPEDPPEAPPPVDPEAIRREVL